MSFAVIGGSFGKFSFGINFRFSQVEREPKKHCTGLSAMTWYVFGLYMTRVGTLRGNPIWQKGVLPWLKIAGNPPMMNRDYRDFQPREYPFLPNGVTP